jgi:hypothetical protein
MGVAEKDESVERIKHEVKSIVRGEVLRESARNVSIDRHTDRHCSQKNKAGAETNLNCLSSQAALQIASFPLKTLLLGRGSKTTYNLAVG